MKAVNIQWDVEYKKDLKRLPKEIEIPDDVADSDNIEDADEDAISDYITDVTGFCHYGFDLEV